MKKTGKGLAALTVAVCLLVSIGVANTSFGQILWVASVDPQMGVLPVYAQPTTNSAMVGSLQRCVRVILTGLEKDSWVEISDPISGWVQADLLSEYSCAPVSVEPTVIEPAPIGVAYGTWHGRHRHHFHDRHNRHHSRDHVRHRGGHHGGHNPGGHQGGHRAGHQGGQHARR
jgi:hypothetical protein